MLQSSIAAWLQKAKPIAELTKTFSTPSDAKDSEEEIVQHAFSNDQTSSASSQSLAGKTEEHVNRQTQAQLPKQAMIVRCDDSNIQGFRRLNALLLPIPYQDSFYKEILQEEVTQSVTRLALWNDSKATSESMTESLHSQASDRGSRVVAGIRCRILPHPPHDSSGNGPILYVSTIGTLAPFRGHRLASAMLSDVIREAINLYGVVCVMAHVWEANEEALEWYKRKGFVVVQAEPGYYRRLAPQSSAFLIRREVRPTDGLG